MCDNLPWRESLLGARDRDTTSRRDGVVELRGHVQRADGGATGRDVEQS